MIDQEVQIELDKLRLRIRELEASADYAKARITNVGNPRSGTDAATKRYVDETVKSATDDLRRDLLALKRKVG